MLPWLKEIVKVRAPRLAMAYRHFQSYWTGRRWVGKGMDAFREIHNRNVWNEPESKSGIGSSLRATEAIRAELPSLLDRLGVKSILDGPCGDFYWMAKTDLGNRSYTGIDVVPALIDELSRKYQADNRHFICLDLSKADLPHADLILCRDCLVHFSFSDIKRTLKNFRRCGARLILTTTFPRHPFNVDCPTGHWRAINLELPPFKFPPPMEILNDDVGKPGVLTDKSLGLWRLDTLPL